MTNSRPHLSRWAKRLGFVASIVLSATVAASLAWAFFSGSSTPQTNSFAAGTLPQGSTPSASVTPANSPTVTLTFAQTTVGSTPVTTYTIYRYDSQTNVLVATLSGSCSASGGTVTCTDTPGDGIWYYTESPSYDSWVGPASADSNGVLVDTTPPTVSPPIVSAGHSYSSNGTTYVDNGVSLTDSASDGTGSGVNNVAYYYCAGATGGCTTATGTEIGSSTTTPYTVTWAGEPADGAYRIVAVGTDNVGNVSNASVATVVTVDNTGPTVTAPSIGAAHSYISGATTFVANGVGISDSGVSDGSGSGVTSVSYYYCAGATGSCTSSSWTAIGTSTSASGNWPLTWSGQPVDGPYRIVAVATDNLGNTTPTPTASTAVIVDNTAPTASAPIIGSVAVSYVSGTTTFVDEENVPFTDTASDAGSGVATVTYYYCATSVGTCTASNGTQIGSPAASSPWSATWSTPLPADNAYEVVAVVADHLGNTTTSAATDVTVDTTAPIVSPPIVNGFS